MNVERYAARRWVCEGWDYLTARKATGVQYESRSGWGNFSDAKVFSTRAAAVNSGRHNLGNDEFEVVKVTVGVIEPSAAPRVAFVCQERGSRDVTHDALARFDEDAQEWSISSLLDNSDCDDCGEQSCVKQVLL